MSFARILFGYRLGDTLKVFLPWHGIIVFAKGIFLIERTKGEEVEFSSCLSRGKQNLGHLGRA